MKKNWVIFTILIGLFLFNTVYAGSTAVMYFSPDVKEVSVGNVFNIKIFVDPKGAELDTVRAAISFPADKLEATHFSLGGLYPNSSPGNFIDNNKGLVYEGGAIFGGKTSEKGVFGTITFKAKSAGTAIISLSSRSHLILAGVEQIDLANSGSAHVAIDVKQLTEPVKVIEKTDNVISKQAVLVVQVLVNSASHPDQARWYIDNNLELNWQMSNTSSRALSYLYSFSQDPESEPDTVISANSKIFEKVDDGVWYFHIKAKLNSKLFTDTATYKLMVDASAPNKLMAILEDSSITEHASTKLHFGTIDRVSGVAFYDLAVDGGAFSPQSSPYLLKGLNPGEHTIIVRALDQAGNVSSDAVRLVVNPGERLAWKAVVQMYWQEFYYLILGGLSLLLLLLLVIIKKNKK